MKASITALELWMNNSLMEFFLSEGAIKTLERLCECDEEGSQHTLNVIDENYSSIDDLEEALSDLTIFELAEKLNIRLETIDDEEDIEL